jgi:cytoskeletal protein CcmA (bactofilin family)
MGIFGKSENQPVVSPRPPSSAPPAPPTSAPARGTHAPPAAPTSPCVIGAKTRLKGEITGEEDVVVEGFVEGTIRISRDLRVARGGTVKATVSAQSVLVAGELIGDCQAAKRVEIEATGKLSGNIRAPRVVIVEGASFRGNSDMSPRREGEGPSGA